MRHTTTFVAAAASVFASTAASAGVCTADYVKSALPADGFIPGTTIDVSTVAANAVGDYSVAATDGVLGVEAVAFCVSILRIKYRL